MKKARLVPQAITGVKIAIIIMKNDAAISVLVSFDFFFTIIFTSSIFFIQIFFLVFNSSFIIKMMINEKCRYPSIYSSTFGNSLEIPKISGSFEK